MTLYPEHRYDDHGQLRPPLWFWPIALLLTRSVWLFLMAGVTRESGSAILTLFYPDKLTLYISLLTDVPAMLALLACGGTHRLSGLTLAARKRVARGEPLDGDWLKASQFVEKYQNYAYRRSAIE